MATRAGRKGSWLKPLAVADWQTYYRELWKPDMAATQPTDKMTLAQFTAARQTLRDALAKFESRPPTCKNCTHFQMGDCEIHGAGVPKEFQDTPEQCTDWKFDGIPF